MQISKRFHHPYSRRVERQDCKLNFSGSKRMGVPSVSLQLEKQMQGAINSHDTEYVSVEMTPDEARRFAASLIDVANRSEKL